MYNVIEDAICMNKVQWNSGWRSEIAFEWTAWEVLLGKRLHARWYLCILYGSE